MFKAELINFKIWDFYSFAKVAVIKLWQMSELNLCKNHIGECLSYRSFCQNLIVKNSTFSLASTDILDFAL